MEDIDALNTLGRRIRAVLRRAKQPLTLDEISKQLGASRHDIHDALSVSLHGWIEMRDGKYRML
jgi:DNA-binding transcriptional regulator GbsR (MarR family)